MDAEGMERATKLDKLRKALNEEDIEKIRGLCSPLPPAIENGVPLPADWLKRLCCFIDGSSSDDPGEIPNYSLSNNVIIKGIRSVPQRLYDILKVPLGCTAVTQYYHVMRVDAKVIAENDLKQIVKEELGCTADEVSHIPNPRSPSINVLAEKISNITKYIYVCLFTESGVQQKGSSFIYEKETYIFVSASRKVKDLMKEFYKEHNSEKRDCVAVEYWEEEQWKRMQEDEDLEVLLTRGGPRPHGSKHLQLVF